MAKKQTSKAISTAADIIKIAMINVNERLKREQKKSRLLLQIHDELLIEA